MQISGLYTHVQAQIHTELAHVRINNCVIAYLTNWHLKLMSGAAREGHRQKLILTRGKTIVYTRHVMVRVCLCVCRSVIHFDSQRNFDLNINQQRTQKWFAWFLACWVGLAVYLFVSSSVCLGVIYHATNTRLSSHQGKRDDGRGTAPTAH